MKSPAVVEIDLQEIVAHHAPKDVDKRRLALLLEASGLDLEELAARAGLARSTAFAASEAHRAWERADAQARGAVGRLEAEAAAVAGPYAMIRAYVAAAQPPDFGGLPGMYPELGRWLADLRRVLGDGRSVSLARPQGPELDPNAVGNAKDAYEVAREAADLAAIRLDAMMAPYIAVARGRAA